MVMQVISYYGNVIYALLNINRNRINEIEGKGQRERTDRNSQAKMEINGEKLNKEGVAQQSTACDKAGAPADGKEDFYDELADWWWEYSDMDIEHQIDDSESDGRDGANLIKVDESGASNLGVCDNRIFNKNCLGVDSSRNEEFECPIDSMEKGMLISTGSIEIQQKSTKNGSQNLLKNSLNEAASGISKVESNKQRVLSIEEWGNQIRRRIKQPVEGDGEFYIQKEPLKMELGNSDGDSSNYPLNPGISDDSTPTKSLLSLLMRTIASDMQNEFDLLIEKRRALKVQNTAIPFVYPIHPYMKNPLQVAF
jgi:hypothetical protein